VRGLAKQQIGDDVAADDEKDIDADITPGEMGNTGVRENDQENRQCA
jgi:hypothetical protein